MAEPRVKGSLVLGAAVAVRRKRTSGRISPEMLEKRLGREAIDLLDAEINVASWYPIRLMQELTDLDWEVAAACKPEYQREAGRKTARHFAKTGLYQQLDFARRHRSAGSRDAVLRQSRMVCTLTATLYDFIQARAEIVGETRLQITFLGAQHFPEALRYSTEGFLDEMTQRKKNFWRSQRPEPDRLAFTLPIRRRS